MVVAAEVPIAGLLLLAVRGGRASAVMLLPQAAARLEPMALQEGLEPLVRQESLAQAMAEVVVVSPQEAILAE